jgi:hypothetical protein
VRTLRTLISAVGLVGSAACLAGPYCVVGTGLGADCKYYDEASCAQAAVERHGACIDRSTGFATGFSRNSRYCLVGGGESKCTFYDAASCAKAALEHGGTCMQRPRS